MVSNYFIATAHRLSTDKKITYYVNLSSKLEIKRYKHKPANLQRTDPQKAEGEFIITFRTYSIVMHGSPAMFDIQGFERLTPVHIESLDLS